MVADRIVKMINKCPRVAARGFPAVPEIDIRILKREVVIRYFIFYNNLVATENIIGA